MNKADTQYSIQSLPEAERPRERLQRWGAEALATAELIAIILGSGMKGMPVLQLAQEIVMRFGTLQVLAEATLSELCSIKGLGVAKALQLKAALSLGVRVAKQGQSLKYLVEHPSHAYFLVRDELAKEKREIFVVILLDSKCYAISHQIVSIGSMTSTIVHPREVFYPAIRHHAVSMVLVHNHPSGDPTPSKEDILLTKTLYETGKMLGISVNDHLIIGGNKFVSMREMGVVFSDGETDIEENQPQSTQSTPRKKRKITGSTGSPSAAG